MKTLIDDITVKHLISCTAIERIQWAHHKAPEGLVATTSGGRTSRILPHLVQQALGRSIPTIFIDTGHYPPQTYKFVADMLADGIDIRFYGASMSPELMISVYGELWKNEGEDFDRFLNMVKHRPMNCAFEQLKPVIWLRGVMGHQTEREKEQVLTYRNNLYQICPMVDWTEKQADDYIKEHHLPANDHHFDVTKGSTYNMRCKIEELCGLDGEGI